MGMRTFPQLPDTPAAPRPLQRRWAWIIGGFFLLLFVVGLAASCASPPPAGERLPAPVPPPAVQPAATPAVPSVAIPQVAGRGGREVLDELRELGLSSVVPVSDEPGTAIVVPEAWIAVRTEPAAGTVVPLTAPVVVKMIPAPEPAPAPAPEPEAAPQPEVAPQRIVTPEVQYVPAAPTRTEVAVQEERRPEPEPETSTYYRNCDAARAAGAAPVHRGEPGYSAKLDRDGDGIGCED